MPRTFSDRPTHEEYVDWYEDLLGDNLESGSAEQWFERVTDAGSRVLEGSEFWQAAAKNTEYLERELRGRSRWIPSPWIGTAAQEDWQENI